MSDAGIEEAELDTCLLITETLGMTDIEYALNPDLQILPHDVKKVMTRVKKRAARQPLSQIFEKKEFWSLNFKVTSDTLTPRADSETLIEATLKKIKDKDRSFTILDLGTGTGCLLLSLLSEYRKATGLGIDISKKALSVAEGNAKRLNLDDRSVFQIGDWARTLEGRKKFDVIISNPPYIGLSEKETLPPEVKDHEPSVALFSGNDGLDDYRKLAEQIGPLLNEKGFCILEIGYNQAQAVKEIFISAGFNSIFLYQDLGGRDRCLVIEK